jgi:hypothetical protein
MGASEFLSRLKKLLQDIEEINRGHVSELHEWEEKELRNIFALLVVGSFTGIPSPPVHITMELLPEMEDDLRIMLNRIQTAHDPLGELFSLLDPM